MQLETHPNPKPIPQDRVEKLLKHHVLEKHVVESLTEDMADRLEQFLQMTPYEWFWHVYRLIRDEWLYIPLSDDIAVYMKKASHEYIGRNTLELRLSSVAVYLSGLAVRLSYVIKYKKDLNKTIHYIQIDVFTVGKWYL